LSQKELVKLVPIKHLSNGKTIQERRDFDDAGKAFKDVAVIYRGPGHHSALARQSCAFVGQARKTEKAFRD